MKSTNIGMMYERMLRSAAWFSAISWSGPNSLPFLAVICSLYIAVQGIGLRFVKMDVPGALHSGESSWLICDFDLGEDELYSVKWYKNNLEFYRYLPSDDPPAQKYDLLGVYVNLSRSNATHVYLRHTDLNTEGTYGCEVSTEAPSFRTVKSDKELRIYVIPDEKPVIESIEPPYQIGDSVNITCTSGPSKPFSHMKWFLNGVEVLPSFEARHPALRHSNGLQSTIIGLEFAIDYGHLWRGRIALACTSSIPQVYSSASEELVIGDRGSTASPYHVSHRAAGQKGPTIEGNLPTYEVGQMIDVNCSSSRSPIPAHIRWFVNGVEPKKEFLIKYLTVRYTDGTEISRLGLRMPVENHHFRSEELRIKCTSTLYRMITRTAERILFSSGENHKFLHYFPNGVCEKRLTNFKMAILFLLVLCKEILWNRVIMK